MKTNNQSKHLANRRLFFEKTWLEELPKTAKALNIFVNDQDSLFNLELLFLEIKNFLIKNRETK